MEDRLTEDEAGRPAGAAIAALMAITVITAGWWALALWPAGDVTPQWLERTRAVCFGTPPGGLPDTRGWLVLIGEPLGLVALLAVVWPGALRADINRLRGSLPGRALLVALPLMIAALTGLAVRQVVAVQRSLSAPAVEPDGTRRAFSTDLAGLVLVDQHGRQQSLALLAEDDALLTTAFAHCATVCPTIVHDLLRDREQSGLATRLVVITLDPWRDTPARLPAIATQWRLHRNDLVLSGGVDEVNLVLDRLEVARSRNTANGDIVHVPVVFRLSGGGIRARLDGGWGAVAGLMED